MRLRNMVAPSFAAMPSLCGAGLNRPFQGYFSSIFKGLQAIKSLDLRADFYIL